MNGVVDTGDMQPGAVALYSCNPGYVLSNTVVRRCLDNGTWDGSDPCCDYK